MTILYFLIIAAGLIGYLIIGAIVAGLVSEPEDEIVLFIFWPVTIPLVILSFIIKPFLEFLLKPFSRLSKFVRRIKK